MALLLVTLTAWVAFRFRDRLTCRMRALVLVAVIVALNVALGAPAQAQTNCGQAPAPERPGSGMVGALDPPVGNGETDSPYLVYGYAGMVWHTYDDSCGTLAFSGPKATVDTWVGNQLFDIAKNLVGVTNALHYTLLNGGVLGRLNDKIGALSRAVFSNIYGQLLSVALLIVVVMLFRHLWRGDLATVTKRGLFTFASVLLAVSGLLLVSYYGRIDNLILTVTTGIQAGFVDPNDNRVVRDVLPTDLHNRVVYDNWLRGEFGKLDVPQASQYGRPLLDTQAWTTSDIINGKDADNAAEQEKQNKYKEIAGQLGPSTGVTGQVPRW